MTCLAPTSTTTCSGSSPSGQQLAYDAERRLAHCQSGSGSSPSASADYLYDGSGNRIEQADTSNGATSQLHYLFGGLKCFV